MKYRWTKISKNIILVGVIFGVISSGILIFHKTRSNNEKKDSTTCQGFVQKNDKGEKIIIHNKNKMNMIDLKKTYEGSSKTRIDEFFEITDMSVNHEANYNLVIGNLNGPHGKFINHVSDKGYFILKGNGEVHIGNEIIQVSPYDFIFIPKNTPHGIKGKLEFIIITSPKFDPKNESDGEKVE